MTTLPTSPAYLRADTALAELEQIRLGWIEQARTELIPERLFDIAYWLGKDTPTLYRGIHRCCILAGFRICVGVVLEKAKPDIAHRLLTVFLDDDTLLMEWHWRYFVRDLDDELPGVVEETDLLYIPGKWLASALAMTGKAEAARVGYARAHEAKEREELAKKMLIGQSI